MRVAWLCEAPTWGPAMRALAVLGPGTDVEGVVLGQRSEVDNEVLIAERVPFVHVGCCGDDSMEHHLARTEADVLVADACWAPLAAADGRPYITLGMHGAGEWDLDSMPLHPWTWQALPRRVDVRALFDVPEDVPVVAIMSNATRVNVIENAVARWAPSHAVVVSLHGPFVARRMVGADLVVTSAGWASSWEARWSGVPYVLVDVGGPDQPRRATHTFDEAREAVSAVTLADLSPGHTAQPEDHVTDFCAVLRRLA